MPRHISKKDQVKILLSELENSIDKNNVDIAIPLLAWTKEKINLSYNEYRRNMEYIRTNKINGKPRQVKRATIYNANLGKNIGSEQNGLRPVLVVQFTRANTTSPNVIVVPLTDAFDRNGKPKRLLDTHVEISHPKLVKKSIIKTEYIRNISKSRLIDEICHIDDPKKIMEIEEKLKKSIGMIT
ncbi:MAG: type II toxin-antitoxin system PemK/MazF family toxin [Desulfocucumaceae bacterium]